MRTAKEMYHYCLEHGFGKGFNKRLVLRNFKLIEENLKPDEEVIMAFTGIHNHKSATNHQGNFAYALTNKRFLMGQKKLMGQTIIEAAPFNHLRDVITSTDAVFGIIKIGTKKEKINIAVDKKQVSKIQEKIQTLLPNP